MVEEAPEYSRRRQKPHLGALLRKPMDHNTTGGPSSEQEALASHSDDQHPKQEALKEEYEARHGYTSRPYNERSHLPGGSGTRTDNVCVLLLAWEGLGFEESPRICKIRVQ